MERVKIGLAVIGLPSFDIARARAVGNDCKEMLAGLGTEVVKNEVSSLDEARRASKDFRTEQVDFLVIQHGTFSPANLSIELIRNLELPIVLWGIPEPPLDGSAYRCGSLVGLTMHGSAIRKSGKRFQFIFGLPKDEAVKLPLERLIRVIYASKKLSNSRIGLFGGRVPGFYVSDYDELMLRNVLGPEVIHVDLSDVLLEYEKISDSQVRHDAERIMRTYRIQGLQESDIITSSKVYVAVMNIIERNDFDASAIKCYPEIRDKHEKGVCFVNSRLNDQGVVAACEGDIYGAVTMMIQRFLTNGVAFFADLVQINREENNGLFWHCGAGPISLARSPKQVKITQYYRGKGGASVEFPLKPGRVTIARLTEKDGRYALFFTGGEALETEMILKGTPLWVKLDAQVDSLLGKIFDLGMEQHYSLIYGDIEEDLAQLCDVLDIEALKV